MTTSQEHTTNTPVVVTGLAFQVDNLSFMALKASNRKTKRGKKEEKR